MPFAPDLPFMANLIEVDNPLSRLAAFDIQIVQHAADIAKTMGLLQSRPDMHREAIEAGIRDLKCRRSQLTYIHGTTAQIFEDNQDTPTIANAAHLVVSAADAARSALDRVNAAYLRALPTAPSVDPHTIAPTSASLLSCNNSLARALADQVRMLDHILAAIDKPDPTTGPATLQVIEEINRHNREALAATCSQLDAWEKFGPNPAYTIFIDSARQHCHDLQGVLDHQSAAYAKLVAIVREGKAEASFPIVIH